MKTKNYRPEVIDEARRLYLLELPIREIASKLGIKRFTTISRWVNQFKWVRTNTPETEQVLDKQIKATDDLILRFEPFIKRMELEEVEPNILMSIYIRILDHQLKLVKLKSNCQVTEQTKSIFEFSENSARHILTK